MAAHLAELYGHRTSHDLDYWYSNAARRRLNEQGNDYVRGRCVGEMVASSRTWEMHLPFTAWGLSIYELAQVVTRTYGGRHCWSPWLNLWADDPERPLPAPPRRLPWKGGWRAQPRPVLTRPSTSTTDGSTRVKA